MKSTRECGRLSPVVCGMVGSKAELVASRRIGVVNMGQGPVDRANWAAWQELQASRSKVWHFLVRRSV